MNTKLEKLLDKASYYTPSETVEIEANSTAEIEFSGLNSERYGINRILIGGTGLDKINCVMDTNNGRSTIIPETRLATVRNLFLFRSIEGAMIIEKGSHARVLLTNNDNQKHTVNFQLVGFDTAHLQQKIEAFESRDLSFPEVDFITLQKMIPANSERLEVSVEMPVFRTRLYRIAMSSEDGDSILVSISQDGSVIKDSVFLSQINDEFKNKRIILPRTLKAKEPFDVSFSNLSDVDINVSLIGETYKL